MKKKIIVAVLAGIVLACSTVVIRSRFLGATGNLCGPEGVGGPCYESLEQAGWPFPWWKDDTGTSVVGRLGPEDMPDPALFLLDASFFGLIIFGILNIPYSGLRSKMRGNTKV